MGSLNKAAQTQLPQLVSIGEVLSNGQADFRVIPARSRLLKARTYPSTAVAQSSVLAVISRTKNTGTKDPQRNGARSRLSERTAAGHSREEEDDEEVRAAPIRREPPRGEGKEPPLAHGQRCAAPQVNAAPGGSAPPRIAPLPDTAARSGSAGLTRHNERQSSAGTAPGWAIGGRMSMDLRYLLFGVKQTAPPHNAALTTWKVGRVAPAALRRNGARCNPPNPHGHAQKTRTSPGEKGSGAPAPRGDPEPLRLRFGQLYHYLTWPSSRASCPRGAPLRPPPLGPLPSQIPAHLRVQLGQRHGHSSAGTAARPARTAPCSPAGSPPCPGEERARRPRGCHAAHLAEPGLTNSSRCGRCALRHP